MTGATSTHSSGPVNLRPPPVAPAPTPGTEAAPTPPPAPVAPVRPPPRPGAASTALEQMGVSPELVGLLDDRRAAHSQLLNTEMETLEDTNARRQQIIDSPTVDVQAPDLHVGEEPTPPSPQRPASGARVYGQFLPLLAILGGAFVRRDATAMLRTGAAAMKAARANDAEEVQIQHQHWEDQMARLLSERTAALQQYNAVLQDANMDITQKQALLSALAAQENNMEMRVRASSGDLTGITENINMQLRAIEAIRDQNRKDGELNERVRHNQAMERRRTAGAGNTEAMQQAQQNVLTAIGDAEKLAMQDGATGVVSQAMRHVGGSPAYNLQAAINTVQANIAFDRLQAMRMASPTGGALGSVSERELELLQSTMASLDISQSREQFLTNLGRVKEQYQRALAALQQDLNADAGGGSQGAAISPDAIAYLRAHPETAAQFEEEFGLEEGAAQEYLGQ